MKKAFSIFLAILMLASNIGIASNTHYCGGEAVERTLSLGLEYLDCGMAEEAKSECAENEGQHELQPIPCCENEHQLLQLEEDVTAAKQSVELSEVFFIAFLHTFISQFYSFQKQNTDYHNYSPPLLEQDVQILFQNFLI